MSNPHGSFIWYELMSKDPDASKKFYDDVVGWNIGPKAAGDMDYRMISASDGHIGGVLRLTDEMFAHGARPTWLGVLRRRRRRRHRREGRRRRRQGADARMGHPRCRPHRDGHRPAGHPVLRDARRERRHQHRIRADGDGPCQLERADDARSGRGARLLRLDLRHHEIGSRCRWGRWATTPFCSMAAPASAR